MRAPVELLLTPDERQRYVAQLRDFKERLLPDVKRRILNPDDPDALDDLNDEISFVQGTIGVLEKMLPNAGTPIERGSHDCRLCATGLPCPGKTRGRN